MAWSIMVDQLPLGSKTLRRRGHRQYRTKRQNVRIRGSRVKVNRFGYKPISTMRIILNADSFGRDQDTFKAAVECFAAGALSSATMLPSASHTPQAVDYALKHPEFSFGVQIPSLNQPPDDE